MMDRRSFLVNNLAAAALGSAAQQSTASASPAQEQGGASVQGGYFQLVTLRLQSGPQVGRMMSWFEKRAIPILQAHKLGPVGVFSVEVGPGIPSTLVVLPYPSLGKMEALSDELAEDKDWTAALTELDAGDPPFYREDVCVLRALPFSPALKAFAPGDAVHQVYEMRIYESPTSRQLGYLHERFAGGEIEIFHKSGIHPILYADTVIGPNMPNLTYLIPFESQGSRKNAWTAFGKNPDWQKLQADSIKKGGEIVRNITNMFLSPASFSMLR
jgi:NIPSNAP protein